VAALAPTLQSANGLALAIVASASAPLLLLDGRLDVEAASASFCAAFRIDPAAVKGRRITALGNGEWDVPQLASLLRTTVSGDVAVPEYEIDFVRPDGALRRLVLNAQKLAFADGARIHILLSILDVTDSRLIEKVKEDLVRDKAVLLQELQHRVANSLQIIASVLMQSARRVQSDETRGYLRDAHHRIMSVASMQRQLAVTRQGDVDLRPYFTELCASIGASMIRDHKKLTLTVDIDDSSVPAEISVSLGLIVTELVINALKHAFPDGRGGTIKMSYHTSKTGWRLAVADDGAGMSQVAVVPRSGLGTSIVGALCSQLGGKLVITSGPNGTEVEMSRVAVIDVTERPAKTEGKQDMNNHLPVSKRGSKSIGEDRGRDDEAAARADKGLSPLAEAPHDEGQSSGHGRDGPPPPTKP
jgi:two-component system, sensor histidine kinase PdtaS